MSVNGCVLIRSTAYPHIGTGTALVAAGIQRRGGFVQGGRFDGEPLQRRGGACMDGNGRVLILLNECPYIELWNGAVSCGCQAEGGYRFGRSV